MQIRLLLSFALRRFFCLTRGLKKHRELPSFCCSSVIWKKEISWAKITKQELLQRHIRRVILCHCCCYVGLIVFLSCTISPKNVFFLFLLFVRSFPSFLQPPVVKKVTCCLFAPGKKSFLLFLRLLLFLAFKTEWPIIKPLTNPMGPILQRVFPS